MRGNCRAMSAFFTLKVSNGDNMFDLEVKKVYVTKRCPLHMLTSQVQQDNTTY